MGARQYDQSETLEAGGINGAEAFARRIDAIPTLTRNRFDPRLSPPAGDNEEYLRGMGVKHWMEVAIKQRFSDPLARGINSRQRDGE